MPTGTVTITVKSYGYQDRAYTRTLDETTYIRLDAYLLQTASGLLQPFVVIDSTSNPIQGASIIAKKIVGGTLTEVASGTTDSSGGLSLFLASGTSHTIIASKLGASQTVTINPSTTTIYITLGGGEINEPWTENNSAYWTISPIGPLLNNSTDTINITFYDSRC